MLEQRDFWQLFAQTGEPMAYLLYKDARAEQKEDTRERDTCSSIQASEVS